MNSRLFYTFKRNFTPTVAYYKAKSLKYLKHLPDKLKDPKQLPDSARGFLPIHREALNIHYKNVNSANEILDPFPENIQINTDLFVGNLTRKELLTAITGSPILKKLNNNEISLAIYLNDVILNEKQSKEFRETFTVSLVNYLLTELELNKHPFTLRAEFSILKENALILIDEDKHIRGLRQQTENGESQISAEILACAFTNFNNAISPTVGKSQTVYAMRVIGTRFTLYKAFL
ncbi:3858_t:CDS:2, partial [Racocetra fulgida]